MRPAPFASAREGHATLNGYGIVDPGAALTALIGPDGAEGDAGVEAPDPAPVGSDEGCGCHVPGRRAPLPWAVFLVGALWLLRRASR